MTIIEKIISAHSKAEIVRPGEIHDVMIDARVARDFGGANVVNNIREHDLEIVDPSKTFFTFDCNPTGSDQKYAANQQICRIFARERGIKVYDINCGIGTHILIEEGLAYPGSTAVSTDSHANILGAVCSFGQGMGDKDIAAAWSKGKIWFKVPGTVKIKLRGEFNRDLTAKDIVLNMLSEFGSHTLLGYAIELYGEEIEKMTIDTRITIASMATEMGAIIILFPPNNEVVRYCESRAGRKIEPVFADQDASYAREFELDAGSFTPRVSRPGKPHDTVSINEIDKIFIDSAFIGSCTNGRIQDMRAVANVLRNRKVAPGVVLKIVPSTDLVWQRCLDEGLMDVFKEAGALVSNAGCAGCAAGQVGQNGPGEVTVSTGNRNFRGKQGNGEVYLASPAVVAASSISGFITTPGNIPSKPLKRKEDIHQRKKQKTLYSEKKYADKPVEVTGRAWFIDKDDIDTDMIFHNRYLTITDVNQMGECTFDNLEGYENFSKKVRKEDIILAGENFGAGSSRQQAVDCFVSLGIRLIIAKSFGAIYERNAINAAFPIIICKQIDELKILDGNKIKVNFATGIIENLTNKRKVKGIPFSEVQMDIYQNGGLF